MTFQVYNQKDFDRAWSLIRVGDAIIIHVEHINDYHFSFSRMSFESEENGGSALKGGTLS